MAEHPGDPGLEEALAALQAIEDPPQEIRIAIGKLNHMKGTFPGK